MSTLESIVRGYDKDIVLKDCQNKTFKYLREKGRSFTTVSRIKWRTYCSANENYKVNPHFINRNKRNLELLALEPKREGWKFQSPRKDYYNKLILEISSKHITGRVEHWTGKTVVSASTKEWAIRQHLHSSNDKAAALNIGRVLAQRCLESGYTNVFYDEQPEHALSEKMQEFLKAIKEEILLVEPDVEKPHYEAGIDYDQPNRYAESKMFRDDVQVS